MVQIRYKKGLPNGSLFFCETVTRFNHRRPPMAAAPLQPPHQESGRFWSSRQIDVPVRFAQEGLPTFIFRVLELASKQWMLARSLGLSYESHARLLGRPSAFAGIAGDTAADDIFPPHLATLATRSHVIQTEFTGRKSLAAILTSISIASENVPPIETHPTAWHFIV